MAVQDTSSQQQSENTKSNTTRSLGSILSGAFNSVGSGLRSVNSWMSNDSFLGEGITNGALVNAGMGALNMGVNMLAGQNQSGVGNTLQTIGGLASNIPGVGGLIGAGVGVVGGLVNAAFGSHINDEFVQQTQLGANQIGSQIFNANTNGDLLNDWQNMAQMSNVSKSEVGSDGWFSNKASRKTRELNEKINAANQRQLANFGIAAENVDTQNDLRILQNMAAYGGPINSFRKYYEDGGLFGNETVDNIAQFVPILGTAEDAYTFYKDPSWANAGWLALSLGSDVFTGGMAGRAIKALRMANKAAEASRTAQKAAEATWKANKKLRSVGQGSGAETLRSIRALGAANATRQAAIRRADQALINAVKAVSLDQGVSVGSNVAQSYDKGGYLSQAKALIRQNEGWRDKPYSDAPKGKNWRSVGYGFNDSGFREKYPEGISKHYEHGITKKQAEEELDYFLNKAEKQLKSIYGKQWNDFTDSQKAAILDTYYQRPASVGKSSRFYKAVTAGEDAGRYLGVSGYNKRNKVRQDIFGGSYSGYGDWSDTESNPNSSPLQEVTPFTPVIHDLDLSGITPTEAKALELNLTSPTFDLSIFGKPMTTPTQQAVPTVGTVEDFLASYGDFEENLFKDGGKLSIKDMNIFDFGGGLTHGVTFDTGVDFVAEGNSHENNPYGGVMVGQDESGVPNLVEEGEFIWNGDYVFSRRMKVPKKLREKYHLKDDATFADAIKVLTKDSEERPLDNISRRTQDHILGEFADSQEELRAVKAQRAMEREQQLQDDFLTGVQFGLGGDLFADGGGIHIKKENRGKFTEQANRAGMGVQEYAAHVMANKEDYPSSTVKRANFAKNAAKWHEDGGFLFDNSFAFGGNISPNFFVDGGTIKKFQDNMRKSGQYTKEEIDALTFEKFGEDAWKYRLSNKNWSQEYDSRTGKNTFSYNRPSSTQVTSNRVDNTGQKAEINQGAKPEVKQSSGKSGAKTTQKKSVATPNSNGIFSYGYYTNGSDGISTPTGFKVDKSGKAFDYTPEYRELVSKLGANDIRAWAAAHPNDPSLKSFLAKGNKLENLTDEQWRTGATDGKYGFMHHVADQLSKDISFDPHEDDVRAAMFGDTPTLNEAIRQAIAMDGYTPEYTADDAAIVNALTPGTTEQSSSFTPKQTWTRYTPMVMSGLMGLREMLTPADYGNADSIMEAAYQVGSPVSIGTEYLGDYRKRDPFDERYLMNLINQRGAATNRNMMNLSGGNRAAAMAGILSNDLTTQMSLAEAARQSYLANRADDAQVAEFNRGTNQFNATAQNQRNQFLAGLNSQRQQAMLSGISQGARLRQAIKDQRDAAIYGNLSNFAQGLGDIGWENSQYNMIGGLADEDVLKYILDKDFITTYKNRLNKKNIGEG